MLLNFFLKEYTWWCSWLLLVFHSEITPGSTQEVTGILPGPAACKVIALLVVLSLQLLPPPISFVGVFACWEAGLGGDWPWGHWWREGAIGGGFGVRTLYAWNKSIINNFVNPDVIIKKKGNSCHWDCLVLKYWVKLFLKTLQYDAIYWKSSFWIFLVPWMKTGMFIMLLFFFCQLVWVIITS